MLWMNALSSLQFNDDLIRHQQIGVIFTDNDAMKVYFNRRLLDNLESS